MLLQKNKPYDITANKVKKWLKPEKLCTKVLFYMIYL